MSNEVTVRKEFLKEIGSIWVKQSVKDGSTFFSGVISADMKKGDSFLVFVNKNKVVSKNHPDLQMFPSSSLEKVDTSLIDSLLPASDDEADF